MVYLFDYASILLTLWTDLSEQKLKERFRQGFNSNYSGMKVSYVVSRKEGRASMVDPSTYHQPVHFHMDSNSTTSTATDHDQVGRK